MPFIASFFVANSLTKIKHVISKISYIFIGRYKPFFPKSEPGSGDGEEGPTPQGRLTVRLVEVTRLQWPGGTGLVRAALAVDSHGWVILFLHLGLSD